MSKKLSASDMLKIAPMLTGKPTSVPMSLQVGVDVTNPNNAEAVMQGVQYILSIDGVQLTTGQVNTPVSVPGSSTRMMPLDIGFDLAVLLNGQSKDVAVNIIKNLAGINNAKSKVKFDIKPSFKLGNQILTSPSYIPLEFVL
jgi:LEA14-like dessication related protein